MLVKNYVGRECDYFLRFHKGVHLCLDVKIAYKRNLLKHRTISSSIRSWVGLYRAEESVNVCSLNVHLL